MGKKDKIDVTKERLLDEAEVLFAQKGYDVVTVREITAAAGCNLASINYHFGNKQNLYIGVFRSRWLPRVRRIHEFFTNSLASQNLFSPAAIVQALARAFLEGPLSDEERQRHFRLIVKEITNPTPAFDLVVTEVMRPIFTELAGMLRSAMPEDKGEEDLMLNILSIFAMVFHFNFARAAITRITGREYDTDFKTRLVDHIIKFSLEGLGESNKECSL